MPTNLIGMIFTYISQCSKDVSVTLQTLYNLSILIFIQVNNESRYLIPHETFL